MPHPVRSTLTALLMLAMIVPGPPASAAAPPAAEKVIRSFVDAVNARAVRVVRASCTPDAVVIDEFAPYVWTADACAVWAQAYYALLKQVGASQASIVTGPTRFSDVSPSRAYVVKSTTVTFRIKGNTETETGLWTFVVSRVTGSYLIKSVSWARQSP